jgi:hypothetical protein
VVQGSDRGRIYASPTKGLVCVREVPPYGTKAGAFLSNVTKMIGKMITNCALGIVSSRILRAKAGKVVWGAVACVLQQNSAN